MTISIQKAKRVLSDELKKKISMSRAFQDILFSTLNVVEDDEMLAMVARFAGRILYDLDYSSAFLQTQSHRTILIPVGLVELRNNRGNRAKARAGGR